MTAVEWFAKQVLRSRQLGFISNEKFNELLEQAKEMEKEQREMDFIEGYKKRAKLSGLIFDVASISSAKELFKKLNKQ